jgi:hypothetical protein
MKVKYNDTKKLRQLVLSPENQDDRDFIGELGDRVNKGVNDKWMVWDGDCRFDGEELFGTKFTILDKEVDDE